MADVKRCKHCWVEVCQVHVPDLGMVWMHRPHPGHEGGEYRLCRVATAEPEDIPA